MLERDDTPMPADADAAFAWQRTGAPQVRHSHAFLARLRNLLRDRAPDVLDALVRGRRDRDRVHREPARDAHRPVAASRRRRAGRARVPAHDVRMGAAPARARRAGRRSSATASPRTRSTPTPGAVPRVVGVDGRAGRSRRRRRAVRARRRTNGSRRSAPRPSPRSCTRAASSTSRASTVCAPAPTSAALRRPDRGRSRLPEVRDLPRRQPHVLDHVRDRESRRGVAPCARRRPTAFEAVAGALVATAPWRADGVADPDHRRARDGRAAQPVPAARRRRRRAARARFRRASATRRCARTRSTDAAAASRSCTRSGWPTRCATHGDDLDGLARAFAAFTDRELAAVVPFRGDAGRAGPRAARGAPGRGSARVHAGRVPRRSAARRCARRRSCSARSCAGSTCWRRPTRSMADPEIVAEVLAAYEDRENRPGAPVLGPDRDELLVALARDR